MNGPHAIRLDLGSRDENRFKDGFLLPITSFDDFPHAIRQKLAQEIAFGGLEPRLHAD